MCQSRHYHTGVADDPSMDLRPSVLIDVQKTVSNRQEAAPAAESLRSASLLSGAAAAPALTCRGWQPLAEARYGPSTDQPPRPPSDASERPLLAHLPTSGGKRAERKMTPHPYQVLRRWLSSPSAQQVFPSLPRLRACPPPMRLAEPPQLTRPDGLVVRRYGHPDDTRPPACKRLSFGAASPPCCPP